MKFHIAARKLKKDVNIMENEEARNSCEVLSQSEIYIDLAHNILIL